MKAILTASLSFLLLAPQSPRQLPTALVGNWKVYRPYDSDQPVGLNEQQNLFVQRLVIGLSADSLQVCGKVIALKSVTDESMSSDDFAAVFRVNPARLGLKGPRIRQISINPETFPRSCGDYNDPGSHLFLGADQHLVMEVANAYYSLVKSD